MKLTARASGIVAAILVISACGGGGGGGESSAPAVTVPVSTTLRPSPDGFAFPNFPGSVTPEQFDASDLVAMFGEGACVGGVVDPCEPVAEAAAWARMVNQARASGSCEGLVVEASKRFNAAMKPLTVDLVNEGEVTHKIFRSFATQFFPEVQAERDRWAKKSLRQIVNEIGMSLKSGTTQYTLGLYTANGGHALLPYAVDFTDPDHAILRVYDSNWPGKDRYVELNLQADTWKFSFSGPDPAADANAWVGTAGDMDIGSLDSRTNSLCPFCGSETKVKNSMIVIKSTDDKWSISTANGTYSPSTDNVVEGIKARPIRGAVNIVKALEYVVYVQGSDMQMVLPAATSAFVLQGSAVVQVVSEENTNAVINISSTSVSVNDPNVTLTVASNNLVAAVAGTNTVIDIAPAQLNVATESSTGQKITVTASQEVPQVTARAVDQTTSDGVTDFVVTTKTADNQTRVREVARDGSEKLTTTDKALDLNVVTAKLPDVLKSEMVKPGLPPLETRNLANPLYVADASFVPQAGVIASRTIGSRACDVPGFPSNWIIQADATTCTASLLTITAVAKVVNVIGSECIDNGVTGVWSPFGEIGSTVCLPKVVLAAQKILVTTKLGQACNEYGVTGVFVAVDAGLSCQASRTLNAVVQLSSSNCTLSGFPDGWVSSPTGSTCVAPVVGVAALKKAGTSCTLGDASGTWGFTDGSTTVECIIPKIVVVAAISLKSRFLTIDGISSSYSYSMSDTPPMVKGTASAGGGAISYSSSPAVVCSIGVGSGAVSFVSPGMCYVTASIASDGVYPAASATRKFMLSVLDKVNSPLTTSTTTTSTIPEVINLTRGITVNGLSPSLSYLMSDTPPMVKGVASAGGGAISYSSSPAVVCSIGVGSGAVSFVSPGMCYVTASIASDGVYPATSSTAKFSVTLVVATTTTTSTTTTTTIAPVLSSRTLTIDAGSYTSTYAMSATPPTLTSTASAGGGVISFSSSPAVVCSIGSTSGTVSFVAAGTCTISASIAADSTYASATASNISFSITLTSRTVAIDAVSYTSTYAMSATPPTLTSTASAGGGTKSYTSTTTSVCTVGSASGVVTFVAAGTCTINASIAADSTYASATASNISFSITLTSRTVAIDAGSYTSTYAMSATPPTLTSTASAGGGTKSYTSTTTSVCTVGSASGVVTFVAAGTCTINASIAADSTYASATASNISFSITATSRTIAIDAGSYSASYNRYATAPTLTSTASAGLGTKTYTSTTTPVCTINGSSGAVSLVTAGTCTLRVAIASDGTYDLATSSTVSLTVTYALGDTGPGGGKIFMTLSTSGNTTGKYFESALGTWNAGTDINNRWCNNTNLAIGTAAQGTVIGTGQANTNAIVAVCTAGAAVDARAYAGGGLNDWFLPSQAELQEMYTRRTTIGGFTTLSQLYGGSGTTQSYWSSSEAVSPYSPATQAIPVAFNNGGGDNYGKIYGFNVRPIRMFSPIG